MRKIPLLAGRCPYCLDEDQGVYGRLFLLLMLIVSLVIAGTYVSKKGGDKEVKEKIEKLVDDL